MRFWSKNDGLFDVLVKSLTLVSTSGGLFFGVYVYFHTIHPIFEKETALQNLKSEKVSLQSDNIDLQNKYVVLNRSMENFKGQVNAQKVKLASLQESVRLKENELAVMKKNLTSVHDEVILSKLNIIMDKLISSYLLHVTSGRKGIFNVLDLSFEMLSKHNSNSSKNSYDDEAYAYFSRYYDERKGEIFIVGDDVIKYAVMLPYSYKVKYSALQK